MTDPMSVALDALRSDAAVWERASDDLRVPRDAVGSLGVTDVDVSAFGVQAGFNQTYREAQSALDAFLSDGLNNLHGLGMALRDAAAMYEQQEHLYREQVRRAGEK